MKNSNWINFCEFIYTSEIEDLTQEEAIKNFLVVNVEGDRSIPWHLYVLTTLCSKTLLKICTLPRLGLGLKKIVKEKKTLLHNFVCFQMPKKGLKYFNICARTYLCIKKLCYLRGSRLSQCFILPTVVHSFCSLPSK